MADLSTLARPYAKAAFDYASEHDKVTDWEDFLLFSSYVVSDGLFKQVLHNPAITTEKKASILMDIYNSEIAVNTTEPPLRRLLSRLSGTTNKTSSELNNFVIQLAENGRLALMPHIYKHFHKHKTEASKQIDVYVTSAYPLTDEQKISIENKFSTSMNANVVLHESIDESLLAGTTIKVGDKVIDDSVRGKLKQLKTQLTA